MVTKSRFPLPPIIPSVIMALKVAAVLLCMAAFAIPSTQAGIPGCCVTTRRNIPVKVLRNVVGWTMQRSSGPCDIDAVILHTVHKNNRVCLDLSVFKDLMALREKWMMREQKQRKKKRHTRVIS